MTCFLSTRRDFGEDKLVSDTHNIGCEQATVLSMDLKMPVLFFWMIPHDI